MCASSHPASDFSRHLPYLKTAELWVSCGSKVNATDKVCFKCGHKVPDNSPTTRRITPEEENAPSSSLAKSLAQFVASKGPFIIYAGGGLARIRGGSRQFQDSPTGDH